MNKVTPDQILALLPQTQCRKCGYGSCRDYAEAIAKGAPVNCCPTGGEKGVRRLARLTGKPCIPLDIRHGQERPRDIAVIDESFCIGCRLCIKACPVDAIIGASGFTHTVLATQCTGCDLCLPVCPADCIVMKNVSGPKTGWAAWSLAQAARARTDHERHHARTRMREKNERQRLETLAKAGTTGKNRKNAILAAMEKARTKATK